MATNTKFSIQGTVVNKTTNAPISRAWVLAYHRTDTDPRARVLTADDGKFKMDFIWPPDTAVHTNRPDVYFKVIQRIDGSERVIYTENPATQTRNNIGDIISVTLRAAEGITRAPAPLTARPEDNLFIFTRVGNIPIQNIDTKNVNGMAPGAVHTAATGYANPNPLPPAPNAGTAAVTTAVAAPNSPFGSTLTIGGWFGPMAPVYRYKMRYSTDGVTWNDISEPLVNSYFRFDFVTGGDWVNVVMGPFDEGGQRNVYKLPYIEQPIAPWTFPDVLMHWDTTKVSNGLYILKVETYAVDPSNPALLVETTSSVHMSAAYGKAKLRIDNLPPRARLGRIVHFAPGSTTGTEVSVCDIMTLTTGRLRFHFEASDATEGHLGGYSLNGMFGHNQTLPPPVTPAPGSTPVPDKASDNYSAHIDSTRRWFGNADYVVEYNAAAGTPVYTPAVMPRCAYQFRLNVSKRTTNGVNNIFSLEDTKHITINR